MCITFHALIFFFFQRFCFFMCVYVLYGTLFEKFFTPIRFNLNNMFASSSWRLVIQITSKHTSKRINFFLSLRFISFYVMQDWIPYVNSKIRYISTLGKSKRWLKFSETFNVSSWYVVLFRHHHSQTTSIQAHFTAVEAVTYILYHIDSKLEPKNAKIWKSA